MPYFRTMVMEMAILCAMNSQSVIIAMTSRRHSWRRVRTVHL